MIKAAAPALVPPLLADSLYRLFVGRLGFEPCVGVVVCGHAQLFAVDDRTVRPVRVRIGLEPSRQFLQQFIVRSGLERSRRFPVAHFIGIEETELHKGVNRIAFLCPGNDDDGFGGEVAPLVVLTPKSRDAESRLVADFVNRRIMRQLCEICFPIHIFHYEIKSTSCQHAEEVFRVEKPLFTVVYYFSG